MEKKLGRKLAFASADIFGGGSFNIINFLYPGFLALTIGISPYWAGFVMLVARIWDAFTDPLMGNISDRTKSRFGKRRIYHIIAAPFILVSMYFLFFPYDFSAESLRVIAVLASYILFTTVQTIIMIPYYSLSSEIASDYQERAVYNSFRLGFSIFSSILCVAVPGIIVTMFGDERVGYQVMSISFGIIFMISVLITGLFAKEEIVSQPVKSKLNFKELSRPFKLKSYRQYLGMFMLLQISMAIMSGLFFFYINFHILKTDTSLGIKGITGMIAAALMFMMQIIALPIYLKMIAKKGKTYAYRFGSYIWIVCVILLFFIPANANVLWIFLLAAIIGFGISGPGLVPHTMYGDIVDAGELKLGVRLEGQMSGFANFLSKIAQSIGLASMMIIIGLAGFTEERPGETILSQPDSALLAIRLIMSLAPLIFMGLGILISYMYKIDAKMQGEIVKLIANKEKNEELLKLL